LNTGSFIEGNPFGYSKYQKEPLREGAPRVSVKINEKISFPWPGADIREPSTSSKPKLLKKKGDL